MGKGILSKDYILITLVSFLASIPTYMFSSTIGLYAVSLGATVTFTGFIASFYSISSVIMRPVSAPLMNRSRRKNLLIAGIVLLMVASLALAFIENLYFILVLRFLQGVSYSIYTACTMTIVSGLLPKEHLGEGIGYFGLALLLAQAVGPSIATFIYNQFGFFVMVLLTEVIMVITILCTLMVNEVPQEIPEAPVGRKRKLTVSEFVEPTALIPAVIAALFAILNSVLISFIVLFGEESGIERIALFFSVQAVFMAVARFTTGKLADRKSMQFMVSCVGVILAIAMVILSFADTWILAMLSAAIFGFGYGTLMPVTQSNCLKNCPPERAGTGSTTYYLGVDFGFVIGGTLGGFIADHIGYAALFRVMLVPIALALAVSYVPLLRNKIKERREGS